MRLPTTATPWKTDVAYRAYVLAQLKKTQDPKWKDFHGARTLQMVQLLLASDPRPPAGRTVLCVGCRNRYELDVLQVAGFSPLGIDLVSTGPDILAMDMHRLAFPDQSFDVIYSCHSLEHAYDVTQVLTEWARVTTPGGTWIVEVPLGYETTQVDRQDFGTLDGLRAVLKPYLAQELAAVGGRGGAGRIVGMVP